MRKITDEEFDKIISDAMNELPEQYIAGLKNIAITYEDDPSPEQRKKLKLRCNQTLFGLYEGIPQTKLPTAMSGISGNPMVLPDKITIFKNPILQASRDLVEFKRQVKHTLWHEIAHYYGLDHERIHGIEDGKY